MFSYNKMSDQYSINPVSRSTNNFFESLTNSTNPTYIQPICQPQYNNPIESKYSGSVVVPPLIPPPAPTTIYPKPTTMYTPEHLRNNFKPLNDSYNDAYYNR
jgi:hypothetical protein